MARITTIPLFLNLSLSAGDSGTSDPIDLRYAANNGYFSLNIGIAAGTSTTCGTTVFTYQSGVSLKGDFVTPASAIEIGRLGTSGTSDVRSFQPELSPFMKIVATQTGSGTAGANSKITAELNVQ